MPHDTKKSNMYDIRPPPSDREEITIEDKRCLKVECIGSIDIEFHGYTDEGATLHGVSYIPGPGFTIYSVREVSRTNLVVSRFFWYLHNCYKSNVSQKHEGIILACNPSPRQGCRGQESS